MHGSLPMRAIILALAALPLALLASASCRDDSSPVTATKGAGQETTTEVLTTGAELIQPEGPVDRIAMYLVGFHPMVDDPTHVMEAHHYCHQVNEDFAQCVLYDGNTADAHMNGIEYIISERLFEGLPAAERRYWHPHNHEILSGQLVLPGLPAAAEKEALARKMNSYGKTWHLWRSGGPEQAGDPLPLGEPQLAWSFNADGEMSSALLRARDRRMDIDSHEKRRERADLVDQARPQEGVDRLADRYPGRRPLPGVVARPAP